MFQEMYDMISMLFLNKSEKMIKKLGVYRKKVYKSLKENYALCYI